MRIDGFPSDPAYRLPKGANSAKALSIVRWAASICTNFDWVWINFIHLWIHTVKIIYTCKLQFNCIDTLVIWRKSYYIYFQLKSMMSNIPPSKYDLILHKNKINLHKVYELICPQLHQAYWGMRVVVKPDKDFHFATLSEYTAGIGRGSTTSSPIRTWSRTLSKGFSRTWSA